MQAAVEERVQAQRRQKHTGCYPEVQARLRVCKLTKLAACAGRTLKCKLTKQGVSISVKRPSAGPSWIAENENGLQR